MNFRDKMCLKFSDKKVNHDYEYEANYIDHEVPEYYLYRLHYVDFGRSGEGYGCTSKNVTMTDWPFDNFTLPKNMDKKDAFKVLSYLTDYIEHDSNLEEGSWASVNALNNVLDIKRLGFNKVESKSNEKDPNVIDLFTISGRILLFERTEYYNRYFEWYTPNVTLDEVKEIYNNIGIEFYDLVPKNNEMQLKMIK